MRRRKARAHRGKQICALDVTPSTISLVLFSAGFSFFGLRKTEEVKGKVVPTKNGEEEELSESKKLLQQVKDAGVAGIISYIFCAAS